ncbi:nucleoside triphosphate pyrophosphohydrolase [Candidatus Methylomirabilis sp.]|uniref:nucleoside triphosphate pyrophosphohydrolase n=1 Tax=Candidatus Methylomirabilis sp. TaxID=2032687 RepID=UPI002A612648|nr:nucleoside triphosphate pyrophosphohydrolase [Candidatus Methylomirabilis sp.]
MAEASGEQLEALVQIMERLRADNGCPWDREQTRETLKPFLIEEAYEVVEAIDEGDPKQIMEELGDLLLQVVFHAQLAAERREFTIGQVLAATADKMVRRHPHVFGDATASTAREVLEQWEELKRKERNTAAAIPVSALDGVPRELPGLLRAQRLQDKAARVGFDWPEISGVMAKVEEELGELKEAIGSAAPEEVEAELGDVLFSLVNLARFLNLSAEEALRKSTTRFTTRFRYIEEALRQDGRCLSEVGLEEMERLWQQAKSRGRS